jgi:hypothetical protein
MIVNQAPAHRTGREGKAGQYRRWLVSDQRPGCIVVDLNAPARSGRGPIRIGVVALLLVASFLTALPWLGCSWNPVTHVIDSSLLGICTFGAAGVQFRPSSGLPGFTGPYWGNLIVGLAYLIAAIFAAVTRRPL